MFVRRRSCRRLVRDVCPELELSAVGRHSPPPPLRGGTSAGVRFAHAGTADSHTADHPPPTPSPTSTALFCGGAVVVFWSNSLRIEARQGRNRPALEPGTGAWHWSLAPDVRVAGVVCVVRKSTESGRVSTAGAKFAHTLTLMLPQTSATLTGSSRRRIWISLLCTECEVTWRGKLESCCWACGEVGVQTASTITIVE